jgi:S1-C subfamily serine protease
MRQFFTIVFILLLATPAQAAAATTPPDEAERLYQAYGGALYQVEVIDQTSGKKTSIGSGFQFSKDGLIATNYHVVAEALQRPGSNRIEYLNDKGDSGPLKVMIADVVHDLAIVKMDKPGTTWLALGTSQLPKGTKLFSLGNPHDIGFTIIEGTFNGPSRDSFVENIHFSGALNPGMSGGPAMSHDGTVVGINVATAGNEISFLVPVEPLKALLARYLSLPSGYTFVDHANAHLQDQLLTSQDHNINALLANKKWESVPFGPVSVPGHIHDVLKCWGGTNHKETDPYEDYFSICSSQDRIFLDNEFDTGVILYRYNYIVAKDKLNLMRFYNFYQGQFSVPDGDFQNAKEGDVTNFDCNSRFVDLAGFRWKSNFCVRQYKKYPAIYDMHLYMAMVGAGKQGFIVTLAAQGVSRQNALALARRFMTEIRPRADKAVAGAPKSPPRYLSEKSPS